MRMIALAAMCLMVLACSQSGRQGMPESPVWVLSAPVPESRLSLETYPSAFTLFAIHWSELGNKDGEILLSGMPVSELDEESVVFARSALYADQSQGIDVDLASGGRVVLFVNHRLVFSGEGEGRAITLDLDPGLNEVLFVFEADKSVALTYGGETALAGIPGSSMTVEKVWEVTGLNVPESVIHDPHRHAFYVSNYAQAGDNSGSISLLCADGVLLEKDWVTGLDNPTGMYLADDSLYIVERRFLTVVDVADGTISRRYELPPGTFYNDVAGDGQGRLFISDTSTDLAAQHILLLENDKFSVFSGGDFLHRTNGLHLHGNHLIAGSTGSAALVRLSLSDGTAAPMMRLAGGIIDGIRTYDDHTLLVSQWRGRLFSVSGEHDLEMVLDTPGLNIADFEYVPETGLLVIPTFFGNSVVAYRLGEQAG